MNILVGLANVAYHMPMEILLVRGHSRKFPNSAQGSKVSLGAILQVETSEHKKACFFVLRAAMVTKDEAKAQTTGPFCVFLRAPVLQACFHCLKCGCA